MVKKVILIDDDADERLLFAEAISEIAPGVVCVTAADCRQLIKEIVHGTEPLPDVIFLDVNMPISGWECLKEIKKSVRAFDVPVFMYSNSSHASDVERAKSGGAAGFCTKARSFRDMKTSLLNIVLNLENLPFVVCP